MLSREDQRRFDQITRELRATDPKFFARLERRARLRRHRVLLTLTILLWIAVPPVAVLGGWFAGPACLALLAAAGGLTWRVRSRW